MYCKSHHGKGLDRCHKYIRQEKLWFNRPNKEYARNQTSKQVIIDNATYNQSNTVLHTKK